MQKYKLFSSINIHLPKYQNACCKVSCEFWKEVLSWRKENNIAIESFGEKGLFLGIF